MTVRLSPYPLQDAKEVLGDLAPACISILPHATLSFLVACQAPWPPGVPQHPRSFPPLSLFAEKTTSEVNAPPLPFIPSQSQSLDTRCVCLLPTSPLASELWRAGFTSLSAAAVVSSTPCSVNTHQLLSSCRNCSEGILDLFSLRVLSSAFSIAILL